MRASGSTSGSTTAGSLDARHQEEVRAIERQRTRALEQMACDGKAAEEEAEALRQVMLLYSKEQLLPLLIKVRLHTCCQCCCR
jgi:hypothetical protein